MSIMFFMSKIMMEAVKRTMQAIIAQSWHARILNIHELFVPNPLYGNKVLTVMEP